jgi:hypothetical protein
MLIIEIALGILLAFWIIAILAEHGERIGETIGVIFRFSWKATLILLWFGALTFVVVGH